MYHILKDNKYNTIYVEIVVSYILLGYKYVLLINMTSGEFTVY